VAVLQAWPSAENLMIVLSPSFAAYRFPAISNVNPFGRFRPVMATLGVLSAATLLIVLPTLFAM
jgi:hypothetical protein